MACTDYPTYWQFLANFQFYDAFYCFFGEQVGFFLAPLIIFGALGVSYYIFSGFIMVLVLMIILGGVVIVQLPPGPIRLIGIAVLFGVGMAGYLLVQRLDT